MILCRIHPSVILFTIHLSVIPVSGILCRIDFLAISVPVILVSVIHEHVHHRQLSEAKQRMAEMEEVMHVISASRGSGKPLSEVLTPLQLRLLQQAEVGNEPLRKYMIV